MASKTHQLTDLVVEGLRGLGYVDVKEVDEAQDRGFDVIARKPGDKWVVVECKFGGARDALTVNSVMQTRAEWLELGDKRSHVLPLLCTNMAVGNAVRTASESYGVPILTLVDADWMKVKDGLKTCIERSRTAADRRVLLN